ncbi:DNA-binding protein [Apiospora hydei]|uniref:DNA-binding protein n=1 Tax=Apiospora hydei TaxID=1337664 RepID=A0ABR1XC27_9PEZI
MTASDLEGWLKGESSESAGWAKDDGSGETVGHESGRKIIEILKKNPEKDAAKYDEDDLPHTRKVVAYCKRHLAQEGKAKQDTDSKSARSLKNWGARSAEGGLICSFILPGGYWLGRMDSQCPDRQSVPASGHSHR